MPHPQQCCKDWYLHKQEAQLSYLMKALPAMRSSAIASLIRISLLKEKMKILCICAFRKKSVPLHRDRKQSSMSVIQLLQAERSNMPIKMEKIFMKKSIKKQKKQSEILLFSYFLFYGLQPLVVYYAWSVYGRITAMLITVLLYVLFLFVMCLPDLFANLENAE